MSQKEIKPEDIEISFEGKNTTIGNLSKKQSVRLIAVLLKEKAIVQQACRNIAMFGAPELFKPRQ